MSGMKRLRIFAGPNGSGKSTIKGLVSGHFKLGIYVNADEMKALAERQSFLDFSDYGVSLSLADLIRYIQLHPLFKQIGSIDVEKDLFSKANRLYFINPQTIDGYLILIIADYIRSRLLETAERFSFETVLSNSAKLSFMREAKARGLKVYLYFVSLAAPEMNVERIKSRVEQGGHDVPKDKVMDRYYRTMDFLFEAMKIADNVYLFDNSYQEPALFAKKENDILEIVGDKRYVPKWYQDHVLDKLPKNTE